MKGFKDMMVGYAITVEHNLLDLLVSLVSVITRLGNFITLKHNLLLERVEPLNLLGGDSFSLQCRWNYKFIDLNRKSIHQDQVIFPFTFGTFEEVQRGVEAGFKSLTFTFLKGVIIFG